MIPQLGNDLTMPEKHRYTAKEHRQVAHIKETEEARGMESEEAEAVGYATVNKQNPQAHRYTTKEKRQAGHIIESEEALGKTKAQAERIAYATINKQSK